MKRDLSAEQLSEAGIVTRLDAMLTELRELRRLYLRSVGTDGADSKLAELLRAIQAWTRGDYVFTVRELILHAKLPAATSLRAAIVAVIGELDKEAGKRLGQLLRRNADRDVGGLQIRREGQDAAGAIWVINSHAE